MDRTIPAQNGATIKIPAGVKSIQIQAIQKGKVVMVTLKGVV